MDYSIEKVAERLRGLRELFGISVDEMAEVCGVSPESYRMAEEGKTDFSFTFLYLCSERFGIDLMELATGDSPRLSFYSIVRSGKGLNVSRRSGLSYKHIAYTFKEKIAEPFVVTAPYSEEEQTAEIALSYHEGQEMDYILSGSLKVRFEDRIEIAREGDCLYYDSSRGHGMVATGGKDCVFLAIVMKRWEE
ncbi:MAG: XRE family transcriptional regulator [Eubacteriaceae bacterium]|nr:XRE family transcriptional regulator [Eubacteriaceae bacterium]